MAWIIKLGLGGAAVLAFGYAALVVIAAVFTLWLLLASEPDYLG